MSPGNDKILHLAKHYHPVHGGIETATKDLAEAAVCLGFHVKCHSIGLGPRPEDYWHGGVHVRAFPQIGKIFSAPLSLSLFFHGIDDSSIIHLHLPNPTMELRVLLSLWVSRRARRGVFPFFHAFPVRQGWIGRLWFRLVTAPILRFSRAILVSDPRLLETFPMLLKWKQKVVVMPFVSDPLSSLEWEQLKGERLRAKTVVAVGRMVSYKGFDVLLKAWSQIEKDPVHGEFCLQLIGSGPEEVRLKRLAEDLGLAAVDFLGPLTEEKKWEKLRSACLLVAPSLSRAETFGISVLEAMSLGLPVITTRLDTGLSTLARSGQCGGITDPGNIEQLVTSLRSILRDPAAALDTYGKGNLNFVQSNHSRSRLRERYADFLNAQLSR